MLLFESWLRHEVPPNPVASERVSISSSGQEADSDSGDAGPSISADGRFVVFQSEASNLVANDFNGRYDIFLEEFLAILRRQVHD